MIRNPDYSQPFAEWEEVDVTFPSAPNTDQFVPVTISIRNPEFISYIPIRKDRAADVYHDTSTARLAWQAGRIYLRCSVANARVTFLLYVGHAPDKPGF